MTHVQEQQELRKQTISAFHTAVDEENSDDDLLVPREKTRDEREQEEEEYRDFLERNVGEDLQNLITLDDGDLPVAAKDDATPEPATETKEEKKRRKKEKKKAKAMGKNKEDEDKEFLMKCVHCLTSDSYFNTFFQLYIQSRVDRSELRSCADIQRGHKRDPKYESRRW